MRVRPLLLPLLSASLLLFSVRHFFTGFTTANESIRFFFVASVVENGTLQLDRTLARYRSNNMDRAERDGHAYLDKPPGQPLLALPGYLLYTRLLHRSAPHPPPPPLDGVLFWMTVFGCTLPALGGAAALAIAARRENLLGETGAPPFVLGLLVATPLLLYATQLFGHAAAAAALSGALAALLWRRFLWAGALAGFAVTCEYTTAVFVLALAIYALFRGRWRALGWFALGGLPLAIALGLYHRAAFGGPFLTGYAFKVAYMETHSQGLYGIAGLRADALYGITFSRRRGLFMLAPWLLLAIPGCVAMIRDHIQRATGILVASLCALSIGMIGAYGVWHGGDCVGPRFLVPALPFFVLGAMWAPKLHPALRIVGAGLAAAAAIQLFLPFVTFPFYPPEVADPVYQLSLPLLLSGHHAGLVLPASALVLVLVLAAWRRPMWDVVFSGAIAGVFLMVMLVSSPAPDAATLAARRLAVSLFGQ